MWRRGNDPPCNYPSKPSLRGRGIALVGMDPQRSAADLWQTREADAPELVEVEPGSLATVVKAAERIKRRGKGMKLFPTWKTS